MGKGLFITVEGTDGSGKTTQINMMEEYLTSKGYDVILMREPGGTEIGEKIRSIILDCAHTEIGAVAELLLYAAARAQLVSQLVKPALKGGKVVICDRFVDSSYAYQGFGRGIDLKTVADINRAALDGVVPDITFFLDLNPEIALKRRITATGADRIEQEKIDFHMRVYSGYQKLAALYPDRIRTINGNRAAEQVAKDIRLCIDNIL